MSSTPSVEEPSQGLWCWECRRRRLVCDATRPVCKKCASAGIVCPGYEDKKPLVWLAPGRVTSRTRRKKNAPASASGSKPAGEPTSESAIATRSKPEAMALRVRTGPKPERNLEVVLAVSNGKQTHAIAASTEVVIIPRLLVPAELYDAVEAANYYNNQVYPSMLATSLAPTPFIRPVDVYQHHIPTAMGHAFITIALGRKMHLMPIPRHDGGLGGTPDEVKDVRLRLLHHRDVAIRALNQEIKNGLAEMLPTSVDAMIVSVLVLLFAELHHSNTNNWRHHADGLMALVSFRGGMSSLIKSAKYMDTTLLTFLFVSIVGNTTTSADNQITPDLHLELMEQIDELYDLGYFPSFPCPKPLFLEIIRINYLRFEGLSSGPDRSRNATAAELVERICLFSPETWSAAQQDSCQEEWLLLARIYQSAVVLFCISSLASLSILEPTPQLLAIRRQHSARLAKLLKGGVESRYIRSIIMWPVVVAGADATATSTSGGNAVRAFVQDELAVLSLRLGSPLPLGASVMLQNFWESGKTGWEDCFTRPVAFII